MTPALMLLRNTVPATMVTATIPVLAESAGISMTGADVAVLFGSIVSYFLMTGVHELRAMRRETQAIARHETAMKALQDNRALTLAAITQRTNLEGDLAVLKGQHEILRERMTALTQRCDDCDNPQRRD